MTLVCLRRLSQVGKLNQHGTDLENDFFSLSSGKAHQPETRALVDLMEERPFILSLYLRGSDEDVLIPALKDQKMAEYAHLLARQISIIFKQSSFFQIDE